MDLLVDLPTAYSHRRLPPPIRDCDQINCGRRFRNAGIPPHAFVFSLTSSETTFHPPNANTISCSLQCSPANAIACFPPRHARFSYAQLGPQRMPGVYDGSKRGMVALRSRGISPQSRLKRPRFCAHRLRGHAFGRKTTTHAGSAVIISLERS